MKFSANLGFLWTERPLPDAIRAAKAAGFDAVECHWPYDIATADTLEALNETGLTMLGLNTTRGNTDAGDNGLTAVPGREADAKQAIDQAIDYAKAIHCQKIHVLAGTANGVDAEACYISNLQYACDKAARNGQTILIEPLNKYDAPGNFLSLTADAVRIIDQIGAANLKLMFDCYHVQIMEGDLTRRLDALYPYIGHIQFANVPERSSPDRGEINYDHVFAHINTLGYDGYLGAEYRPDGETDASLGWLERYRP